MADSSSGQTDRAENGAEKRREGWFKLGAIAILAVVAGFGVARLTQSCGGGTLSFTLSGVTLQQNAQECLSDLLAEELESNSAEVEGILSNYGFYHVGSRRMVDAIRKLDPESEADADAVRGIREVLWQLDGPFSVPGTLAGADDGFADTLVELEQKLELFEPDDPGAEANRFFAKIWLDQINQTGVFGPRIFNAEARLLEGPHQTINGRRVVYVCAKSSLEDRVMNIYLDEPDRPPMQIKAIGKVDLARFDCNSAAQTFQRYLANQRARFGVAKADFGELYGAIEEGSTLPPRALAKFQVAPRHYAPIEPPKPQEGG